MSNESPTTDELLADISIQIQLPPSKYDEAIDRYHTVAKYLEREGSPLKDMVEEIYPQGSIAIGATIRSARSSDDDMYDVDIIAELDSSMGSDANDYLCVLFDAIRGEKGSRYYDKTERQTRCITIEYSDMHVDITPMVRQTQSHLSIERAGVISHADPEKLFEQKFVETNSLGLAKHINNKMPKASVFSENYVAKLRKFDEAKYLVEKAEIQPAPDQEDIEEKSITTVALQLIKRRMQVLWANKSRDNFRKPPSVMLSLVAADNALGSTSLALELIHLCEAITAIFASQAKVTITNPEYERDELTDRWPESHRIAQDQKMLSDDMIELANKIKLASTYPLLQKRAALGELFGEKTTSAAFDSFYKRNHMETKTDSMSVVPKTGSVALAGVAASTSAPIVKPPSATSWGGTCKD